MDKVIKYDQNKEYTVGYKDIKLIKEGSNIVFIGRDKSILRDNICQLVELLDIQNQTLIINASSPISEYGPQLTQCTYTESALLDTREYKCIVVENISAVTSSNTRFLAQLFESDCMIIMFNLFVESAQLRKYLDYLFLHQNGSYVDVYKIYGTYIAGNLSPTYTYDLILGCVTGLEERNDFISINLKDQTLNWSNIFTWISSYVGGKNIESANNNYKSTSSACGPLIVYEDFM